MCVVVCACVVSVLCGMRVFLCPFTSCSIKPTITLMFNVSSIESHFWSVIPPPPSSLADADQFHLLCPHPLHGHVIKKEVTISLPQK